MAYLSEKEERGLIKHSQKLIEVFLSKFGWQVN